MLPQHDEKHAPRRPRGDEVALRGALLISLVACTALVLSACSDSTSTSGTGGAGAAGGTAGSGGTAGGNPLDGIGLVELVDDSFVFTEGPTWRAAEGTLLFTDIPLNQIYELTPPDSIEVFREDSGNANGLASDPGGLLLAAEHLNRRVSRTLADGTIVAVASEYQGSLLNSPNDLAVRSDGTIYFTDPPYGITEPQRELDFNGVFRVAPDGELTAEWEGAISTRPNGLVLSPDETLLYVADTEENLVAVFDVAPDGSLSNRRAFLEDVSAPDGMAIDPAGNLFVTVTTGILVVDPEGNEWGEITLPGDANPANCTFGGPDARTLYITAREALYQVELQ